jgi:hypothetical protein
VNEAPPSTECEDEKEAKEAKEERQETSRKQDQSFREVKT